MARRNYVSVVDVVQISKLNAVCPSGDPGPQSIPEAEFLDVNGTSVLQSFSSLLFTVNYPSPPALSKSDMKLVCNVNNIYGNLKSEKSQEKKAFYVYEFGFRTLLSHT